MLARIKVGDKVKVISGKYKGKEGEVLTLSKDKSRVKVSGVAILQKFKKTSKDGRSESEVRKEEAFIYSCKVMPICSETNKPCRMRVKFTESGKKLRVSHRSGSGY